MSESKFKVGDRVRLKEEFDIAINGYSTTIPIGEIGVVEDAYDDEVCMSISKNTISISRFDFRKLMQLSLAIPRPPFSRN